MSNLTKIGLAGYALTVTMLASAVVAGLIMKYLEDNKYFTFTIYGVCIMQAMVFSLILAFAGLFV